MQVSAIARMVTNADGQAVLEVAGRPFCELNPVAAAIWKELEGGASRPQIISRLKRTFDTSEERVANEVSSFIDILKENHLAKDSVPTPDFHVQLVWNKGIAARCNWRIPDEFPADKGFSTVLDPVGHIAPPHLLSNLIANPERYAGIRDGDLVWVRLSWIKSFLTQVLPRIKAKFVLITADSDVSAPLPILAEALEILENPSVLHWFAQNCDGPGFMGRMSPVPIGIDFHTLSERPLWDEDISSPQEQERILRSIREEFRPAHKRISKVYIDFAWQPAHLYRPGKRQQILGKLLANPLVVFQSRPLPRRQLWRKWGEHAFVLSPHGVGLDCHRTWEALVCGNIVLVPSSPLDSLYEGLPVVPVTDWSTVTSRNLNTWLEQYTQLEVKEEKLTSQYWVDNMRSKAMQALNAGSRTNSVSEKDVRPPVIDPACF